MPPVVRYLNAKQIEVNSHYLEGLVGFESGRVYRPGLSVHLFEENERIHGCYNRELERMLQDAFERADSCVDQGEVVREAITADTLPGVRAPLSRVKVVPFASELSVAVHDSLQVFREGEPIDRTVLFTVDEFSVGKLCLPSENSRFVPLSRSRILPQRKGNWPCASGRLRAKRTEKMRQVGNRGSGLITKVVAAGG